MNNSNRNPDRAPSVGMSSCAVRGIGGIVLIALVLGVAQWKGSAAASDAAADESASVVEREYMPPQYAYRGIEFDDPVEPF